MSLIDYKKTLKAWGLQENPFDFTPPDEFEQVAAIFHGRKQELESALISLYEGGNVLVRGTWGIGKTALIKTLLYQLQKEVAELKEEMMVIYVDEIPNVSITNFYRALLLAITQQMSGQSTDAKKVADSLTGVMIQSNKTKTEGGVNLLALSLKFTNEPNPSEIREADIYQQLLFWLKEAEGIYGKVVIAIDDLDKKDTPIVQEIIENSLSLFRQGKNRAFVMTGRGFTDLQEATLSSLGIFSEDLNLRRMSNDDLRQIVINYLNTVRKEPLDSIAPFTPEVLDRIIEYAQGTPRQLNSICKKVLHQAARQKCASIDMVAWQNIWPVIQEDFIQKLSPHLQRLLYIAYKQKGISEDISNESLDEIGALTFTELLPELRELESMDLIMRIEDARGFRFIPSKLYLPPVENNPSAGSIN
jgi:Cdc6-like AAA superfamily ATPase